MYAFVVPGGNHGASLTARSLPPESRELAFKVLESWTGIAPRMLSAQESALQARDKSLFFQLPSQHLRL